MRSLQKAVERTQLHEDIQLLIKCFESDSPILNHALIQKMEQNKTLSSSLTDAQKILFVEKYIEYELKVYSSLGISFSLAILMTHLIKNINQLIYEYFTSKISHIDSKYRIGLIHLLNYYFYSFNEEQIKQLFEITKANLLKWNADSTSSHRNDLIKECIKTIYACFINSNTDDFNHFFVMLMTAEEKRFNYPIFLDLSLNPTRWDNFSPKKKIITFQLLLTSLHSEIDEFRLDAIRFLKHHIDTFQEVQLKQLIKPLVKLLDEGKIITLPENSIACYNRDYLTFKIPELLFRKLSLYVSGIAKHNVDCEHTGKLYHEKPISFFTASAALRRRKPSHEELLPSKEDEQNKNHFKLH